MASGEPGWYPTNVLNLSSRTATAASFNDFAMSRCATNVDAGEWWSERMAAERSRPPRVVRAPASVSAPASASASCGNPCGASNAVD